VANRGSRPSGPSGRALLTALVGWVGLAACLTMVYLAMRAVMDVGGACADGGPYVSAQGCPDGATPSLLLGIFGGMGFGFLASMGGFRVGGFWAATPLLAWSGLFGSLGWNFLDYGVFSAPDTGIDLGLAFCGVVFWIMAFGPLLVLVPALGGLSGGRPSAATGRGRTGPAPAVTILDGPGQPARRPVVASPGGTPTVSNRGRTTTVATATATGTPDPHREALTQIAADFGAAIGAAMAQVPADPAARPDAFGDDAGFTEGTQALLDRLERLADMRDRGLLGPDEFETAKAAIMAELEGRT
jgi:hypothetical protein